MKQEKGLQKKFENIEGHLDRILSLLAEKKGLREKPLIFIGPSLSKENTSRLIDAEIWPPIARGDLPKALQKGFRWIGIVDGVFHQSLAVSIQEIRMAIEAGAKIYGGSSMGALRAAEAYPLGMTGIGTIYKWYRDEIIDSDDEVAVAFDPVTLKSLSIPLVNLRATLERVQALNLVDKKTSDGILQAGIDLPFPHRTYENIMDKFKSTSAADTRRLQELLVENEVDLKASDAEDLLRRIQSAYAKIHFSGVK
jgi:Uncharacterized conserved protein